MHGSLLFPLCFVAQHIMSACTHLWAVIYKCVMRDNVSATMFHMHIAVRCQSPGFLVIPHDNHATTLLLTEKKFKLELTTCALCFQATTYGGWHRRIDEV